MLSSKTSFRFFSSEISDMRELFLLFPGQYNYNASFERVCISNWLKKKFPAHAYIHYDFDAHGGFLNPAAWRCDMVWAAYNGLPLALAQVGAVLKLEQQKMSEGRALIRYFCTPTIDEDGNCHFHSPSDAPEKWEVFFFMLQHPHQSQHTPSASYHFAQESDSLHVARRKNPCPGQQISCSQKKHRI